MAPLAEKYATTVEENRLLYNQVQDLKGNIRVFCRIRPAGATGDTTEGLSSGQQTTISLFKCWATAINFGQCPATAIQIQ